MTWGFPHGQEDMFGACACDSSGASRLAIAALAAALSCAPASGPTPAASGAFQPAPPPASALRRRPAGWRPRAPPAAHRRLADLVHGPRRSLRGRKGNARGSLVHPGRAGERAREAGRHDSRPAGRELQDGRSSRGSYTSIRVDPSAALPTAASPSGPTLRTRLHPRRSSGSPCDQGDETQKTRAGGLRVDRVELGRLLRLRGGLFRRPEARGHHRT